MFRKCLNKNGDGKYAFLVVCMDSCVKGQAVKAIVKMKHVNDSNIESFLQSIDQHLLRHFSFTKLYNADAHVVDDLLEQEHLEKALSELLLSEYGFLPEGRDIVDLDRLLWKTGDKTSTSYQYHDNSKGDTVSISFARSIWSLMDQSEYRISTMLKDLNIFPKIYGFCGPLYISEYAPFDSRFDNRTPHGPVNWRERVSTTLQIFKLLRVADMQDYPLHFCDIKLPHFGTAPDGSMKFIDADTVFTNKSLSRDLAAPQSCRSHDDCSFFDCKGWCFKDSGTCSAMRTNNNLQVRFTIIFFFSFLTYFD